MALPETERSQLITEANTRINALYARLHAYQNAAPAEEIAAMDTTYREILRFLTDNHIHSSDIRRTQLRLVRIGDTLHPAQTHIIPPIDEEAVDSPRFNP